MMNGNYEWLLNTNLSHLSGNWVIILRQKVVASGSSKEIYEKLMKIRERYPGESPLVAKIPPENAMIV